MRGPSRLVSPTLLTGLLLACSTALAHPPPVPPPTPLAPPPAAGARPWLGVAMNETPAGVVVTDVIAGSPAESAGISRGDLLDAIDGVSVRTAVSVAERVLASGVGAPLAVRVLRAGAILTFTARLTPAPAGPGGLLGARFLGQPAPAIEAVAPTVGQIPSLANLRGNVIVLDFWATWCRPCRAAMRQFATWHSRFHDRGLQIVGLTDEDPALVARFSQAARVPYTLATDTDSRTASRYGVSAIPTMFILDRAGVVRHVSVGIDANEIRSMETLIESLLAQPAPRR